MRRHAFEVTMAASPVQRIDPHGKQCGRARNVARFTRRRGDDALPEEQAVEERRAS
ncbi:protein of unknown function (plasmid) [Cupriavidus neocaledonicus]|uniref:Uncharacterized protein n=1 Tax=Cupriavidus neocaledonicus TaxID=1040979 RepID=A0A375HKF3_9BURK|nr:hypothetical protein CBM2605_B170106 [Cupriavidus neocaledonicus]SPD58729.1 protein of unknown function [Cupriavidus neocaledonicus]